MFDMLIIYKETTFLNFQELSINLYFKISRDLIKITQHKHHQFFNIYLKF